MTTFDAMAWAGKALQSAAERRARRKALASHGSAWLIQVWNLLLTLGGLGGIAYAAFLIYVPAGFIVAGVCLLITRSVVVWDGGDKP